MNKCLYIYAYNYVSDPLIYAIAEFVPPFDKPSVCASRYKPMFGRHYGLLSLVYSWPLIYIHIACITFTRHIGIAPLASEMLFPTPFPPSRPVCQAWIADAGKSQFLMVT